MDKLITSTAGNKKLQTYHKGTTASQFTPTVTEDIATHVGCTANVAIITETEIIVANAGDSRSVVSKKGIAIDMSEDHKPDNAPEKARIEKAGGFVEENRVKGILNLSRSLGDMEYKKDPTLSAELQMITADPEIKTFKLTKDTQFLILACDGIWDCMTSQECVDFVAE